MANFIESQLFYYYYVCNYLDEIIKITFVAKSTVSSMMMVHSNP